MAGSQGGALKTCPNTGPGTSTTNAGDYPQNWYDQGIAVDPNNPDRVFFDTFEVWLATRTGTAWYDTTCGYSGPNPKPVHVDQHALAFVPGSSSMLLAGNDGGVHGTLNADAARSEHAAADVVQHRPRLQHDRVLLRRHQRQLRDVVEPVGGGRRAGQRAERRRLRVEPTHRFVLQVGAVAARDRR